MPISRGHHCPSAWGCLVLALASFAGSLRAWQDPFGQWGAAGYLELLEINRPPAGRPPTGPLDSAADAADGYTRDGLYGRALDIRLSGPLGFDGWDAALETQTDFNTTSIADAFVSLSARSGKWTFGQCYLPFGWEQQVSKADLPGIQRSLIYGFENYGHVQDWGLQLMAQRGLGARWDFERGLGPDWTGGVQAGAMDFSGGDYLNATGGVGRADLRWERGAWMGTLGYSGLVGRGRLNGPPADFVPLGAPQGAPMAAADVNGKAVVLTSGPDAAVDAGPLHARAETAWQSLAGGLRGGSQITAWLDAEGLLGALGVGPAWRDFRLYAKWDQATSDFGDGVHRADSLYRATVYGLQAPLGWRPATLKLETLTVGDDDFGGILPDGRIYQAQLQLCL